MVLLLVSCFLLNDLIFDYEIYACVNWKLSSQLKVYNL